MSDFGLQFLSMRKGPPKNLRVNPGLKYQLSKEEEAILARQHISYSPYMMYIPAPTQDSVYAKAVSPTALDSSPSLTQTKLTIQDVAARKEHHKRALSFAKSGEVILRNRPNLRLVNNCLITNCSTALQSPSGAEKVLQKHELFAATKIMGLANGEFMDTFFLYLDSEETGYVKYQYLLTLIDNHVNGECSAKTIRSCFEVFRTDKRDSILWKELRMLKGARPEEAKRATRGGTFPMLKILYDIWPERVNADPRLMDYPEFEKWMRTDQRVVLAFMEEIFRQILVQQFNCRRADLVDNDNSPVQG